MTCPNCGYPIDDRTICCPRCRALLWAPHLVILGELGDLADVARTAQRERVTK